MKVLVAEDDSLIRQGLKELLQGDGYQVVEARDGAEALERFRDFRPDFICLDVMMPHMSGYDVCRQIRQENSDVPIIFITAKSEEIDKVLGLELGADDFITKPFGVREVQARIRAVSRRCLKRQKSTPDQAPFEMADLVIHPLELRARRGDETIDLSLRELSILRLLYSRVGQVVDRQLMTDECWGHDYLPNSRHLDQQISQLRKRIELDSKSPRIIRTVHGAGYRYEG
ncbi:MAG TPA: DNA-binding response regulator [Myxococcales bacterium]|nr:DNA-binding response regulator [Myxococcales bacterium]